MREDDGRNLDHKTPEQLRRRAGRPGRTRRPSPRHGRGAGDAQSGGGWLAGQTARGGLEALKARPVPGRPQAVRVQPQRRSTLVVGQDPAGWEFTFGLWTRAMVRERIGPEFAVARSEGSVGRLLGKLGLSPRRPRDRASQQNPEAVGRWKAETCPQSRAEAARGGA